MFSQITSRRTEGFTLIEVIIALAVVSALSVIAIEGSTLAADWYKEKESRAKLETSAEVWRQWLQITPYDYVTTWSGQGYLTLSSSSYVTQLTTWNVTSSDEASARSTDGYGRGITVHITPEKTLSFDRGTSISFRDFYLSSAGPNGTSEFALDSNGNIATVGDDAYVLVSGQDAAARFMRSIFSKADKLATSMQSYYQGRYLRDPARDIFRTYFFHQDSNSASDPEVTGAINVPASDSGTWIAASDLLSQLGLNASDVQSPYGRTAFSVQFTSGARTPANSSPPYTVNLRINIPGLFQSTRQYVQSVQAPI